VFRWYHASWQGEKWKEFVRKYAAQFTARFGKSIAPEGSLLSRNLMTVLNKTRGKELVDVLLFLHTRELPAIETDFRIVTVRYEPAEGEYVEL